MNESSGKLLVFTARNFACIKIVGRGDFKSNVEFSALVEELREQGYGYFVLDLSECTLLDSTLLGVIARLGVQTSEPAKDGKAQGVELLNPNPRIVELLETLGVIQLFKLSQGPLAPPEGLEKVAHAPVEATRTELTQGCLEAHKTLMEVNPENEARFKDVTKFLAENLKRLKATETHG